MTAEAEAEELAGALLESLRALIHAIRRQRLAGDLPAAEQAALSDLKRAGVSTSAGLARVAQITPQAMGVTVASLEARGLVERSPDPEDGRRILLSLTDAGRVVLGSRGSAATRALADALAAQCTPAERRALAVAAPVLQRLADGL